MISLLAAIYIMFSHFVADFICQTHEMAINKYNSLNHLMQHIGAYTAVLFLFMWPILGLEQAFAFAAINGTIHLIVDFFTSKLTHYFFDKKDFHNGFVIIGFDQLIHVSTLLILF